ncbi:site-specific DNA-methyltransferase [Humitalea sp. 24SJ18S-53]|uniref:site-specific DNA-methyltransferase n=1 Tax=Humitalea sp. 24SJ18S-53 TaxID=3422307 RepID=UPI003D679C5E
MDSLKPAKRNPRIHSRKQVRQIADSIKRFGFTNPVLIDDDGGIVAGHGRVAAAKLLGLDVVPVVALGDLTAKERQAYALADNKLALNAGWDQELLAVEFRELIDAGFELELTGFSLAEVDFTLDLASQNRPGKDDPVADQIPTTPEHAVSRPGDLWRLGRHQLLCGDARDASHLDRLMQGREVGLVFTDPPYNVPIDGHVSGLGRVRHREFAMGVGEMAEEEFSRFLASALANMAGHCRDGAILYVCMDWRHLQELSVAGRQSGLELKNLRVWNKTNGGMGSFYRSKHELIFVFKHGAAPHVNSFGLGDTGRYRTNVWDYPGISSIGPGRASEQAMHPTVKPVALVADAIRDCSRRGDSVLDPFAGSGTTLIAAQMTGRVAHLIEYDPAYCDTIIRRFEGYTGKEAVLADGSETFEAVSASRLSAPLSRSEP